MAPSSSSSLLAKSALLACVLLYASLPSFAAVPQGFTNEKLMDVDQVMSFAFIPGNRMIMGKSLCECVCRLCA